MITRIITKTILTTRKSVLLLGPRQVGKSTLMESISMDLVINLADEITFLDYSTQPNLLSELVSQNSAKTIFIDEIQRLPKLLNTIQTIIDMDKNKKIKFYLTGSSPRKLKREKANLLPGRLVNFYLGPFISKEFNYQINTQKILEYGALPEVYLSNDEIENKRVLRSYAANYIKEEIKAEALVRNLDSFARFFSECIKLIGLFIDHTKLSKHSKISRHAIPRYFEILEDTLVGKRIFSLKDDYHSLDLIKHPKFYFFDNGVYNGILGNFTASSDRIGALAEQLVFTQILHSAWAKELDITIFSFRTRSGIEVDFVVEIAETLYAIEVKNSENIIDDDLFALSYFKDNIKHPHVKLLIFHMGTKIFKRGPIEILPWQDGLKEVGL